MQEFNPKVSIIIPVYNGSKYLGEAINSAIAQTYKNIEIIVINDGSDDKNKTEKIAKSYGGKIRYYKKENGGVSTALNLGIKKMTGEYFSWLSHDDMYYPEKIEKQIKKLSRLKDKRLVLFSNFSTIEGNRANEVILNHDMLGKKSKYSLLRGCVNGITPLIPKDIIDEMGYFDPSLRCTQDYEYWWKIQKKYKFVHMEDVLAITRFHPKQVAKLSPKVVPEGNMLWVKMIKDLTDTEKIQYEGSLYNFYLEMVKFLRLTPYAGALGYSEKQLGKIEKDILKVLDTNGIGPSLKGYMNNKILVLEDGMRSLKAKNIELKDELESMKNENIELKEKNTGLAKNIEGIYNSKRFKFIDKVANIKDRIFK